MQFVYICRSGENEELRYSIRSVEKFFPGADIVIAGGAPDWYVGKRIPVNQNRSKYVNASNNILAICNSEDIDDSFVMMNDDFYIIKSFDNFNYFYGGLLKDKINNYQNTSPRNAYVSHLIRLNRKLKDLGISRPLDYELHVPFLVEKNKLRQAIEHDHLWRSIYGNLFSVGGTQINDVKVYSSKENNPRSFQYMDAETCFISSEDKSFQELKNNLLDKILSAPSSKEN